MKEKKKAVLTGGLIAAVLVCAVLAGLFAVRHYTGTGYKNLARRRGVIATCDSVEKEHLSAAMAVDGDDETLASRWSSENNWEDASHYIQLEFPEEISVSFVVLKWERRNVISYALEGSLDGETWQILQSFDTAPAAKRQEIVLEEAVRVRYLRLSTYAVSKEEADYSNLYQNVSLYEFEVYADKPAAYLLKAPVIENAKDGSRRLVMPEAPSGYRVTFIGADLEQVIGADGTVYETIQDKEVTVGYRVEDTSGREETREVSFTVQVPAAVSQDIVQDEVREDADDSEAAPTGDGDPERNPCPAGIPSVAEWCGGEGCFVVGENSRIVVGIDSIPSEMDSHLSETGQGGSAQVKTAEQALWDVAQLFCSQYDNRSKIPRLTVCKGSMEDVRAGDFYLGYADLPNGLGEEGYTCDITDKCVIKAESAVGIRWGTVTILQMLCGSYQQPMLYQGQIRDYPLYQVRGFGIDVARKPVSLDTLYQMMEVMSWYKMNDLSIHLNDNTILATSGLTDSAERAMTADSAFRLESDMRNEKGEPLTSQEYAYTREEIDQFIETARIYGVTVVPEIDTPAHSLAITKLYPEYALRTSNESVDQIDLGQEEAVELVEQLWREAVAEDTGAFRQARIVNIGMDEYYGEGEEYRQFLTRIDQLVQESGKTVRLWGSLSNIGGTTQPSPENLQMNIWSTLWADPQEMYEAGYSLINMQNNHLYIIPGGGYDHLDGRELYENWAPNKFYDYNQTEIIPSYSPQMLGASYMIWNDMSGNLDIGISEYDLFIRFREPLTVLSMKLWGASELEEHAQRLQQLGSPNRQPTAYELLEVYDYNSEAVRPRTFAKKGSACQADSSRYLYADTAAAEPDYEIAMKVWLEPGTGAGSGQRGAVQEKEALAGGGQTGAFQEQILAEGDGVYAKWAFYAVEPQTGRVGFTREGRTYTFDYTLPEGEWVNLKVRGLAGKVILYVEDEEVDAVGSDAPFEEHATFVFPLQRMGRQTSHFDGKMEWEVVYDLEGHHGSVWQLER